MKSEKVPLELLRHPVDKYLSADPFSGDEPDVVGRRVSIVKVRYPVSCTFGRQVGSVTHPPDTVMWSESAIIAGDGPVREYCCLPHIAAAIDFDRYGETDPSSLTCAEASAITPAVTE